MGPCLMLFSSLGHAVSPMSVGFLPAVRPSLLAYLVPLLGVLVPAPGALHWG